MRKPPKVSVCIPSYNHAQFLPATLDAILGQTFQDFEIVVVDDGSSDGSLDILQDYAHKHRDTMRVFTHPGRRNLGISATANLAFRESRGTYWCGHTSDDVSYPNRLECQVSFLENHPDVGWVYGVAEIIDDKGAQLDDKIGLDLSLCPDLMERLIWANCIVAPTTMVRRECILQVGPHDEALLYSDWDLFIRLAARYPAAFIPPPIVQYRLHGNNTSIGVPAKGATETLFRSDRSFTSEGKLRRWSASMPTNQIVTRIPTSEIVFSARRFRISPLHDTLFVRK